jgi:penicillin-binding protein 1C
MSKKRRRLLLGLLLAPVLLGPLAFLLLDLCFPFPWHALERPVAVEVVDRQGRPLRLFLPTDQRWRLPVRLEDLPPRLPAMLVAVEDRRFHLHPGVDPLAVVRAAWSNLRAGRVVSGASTLPMQVARLAHRAETGAPRPRTVQAKVVEAFRAIQLTVHRSKREVLEIYLNRAPMGGNLEGVGAAARFLFGKAPDRLSVGEMALLVALPRSPSRLDPVRHPVAARRARDRVLADLARRGLLSADEAARAAAQPLPDRLQPVPWSAPHLARHLGAGSPGGRVAATLDLALQRTAEAVVARRAVELRAAGLGNTAAVVIDLPTRAVRAWVGSARFLDAAYQGQVDGVLARRSPGSALKPFLYALALDDGLVVTDSWLLDVPRDYSGYVPENYDGRFHGQVSVREALQTSLNAPAVALLQRAGLARFHRLLRDGGLTSLDPSPGRHGLPLALGAGEVTLLELTNLYATLARGGLHRPVALTVEAVGAAPERPLFSPGAAQLVAEILGEIERPDLPGSWDLAAGVPAVAWKTGTSFGHRDAWAVGFSGRWAIGVWVGWFDGRAVEGISGTQHAGPLLFDLFRALPGGAGAAPPRELPQLEVCETSRQLPGPYCPLRRQVAYLPGRTRLPPCDYHRRVFVDEDSGELLAGRCREPHRRVARVLTAYPPELTGWWRSQGQAVEEPPLPAADCQGGGGAPPPRIVSPDAATPYRLRPEVPVEFQKVPLLARADTAAGRLFWYQDGRLLAQGAPGEPLLLTLEPGLHRLVVVDQAGRSDRVEYRVE